MIALVTGASSGIGRACALALAARGAQLVIGGRRRDKLDEICSEVPTALALEGDLADPAICDALFETAVACFGRIDVVVNNAGIMTSGPAEAVSVDDIGAMVRLNVEAAFRVMYRAVKRFKLQGSGDLFNISSSIATRPVAEAGAYAATKAAVTTLAQSLRLELARTDVRITTLSPGLVQSDLHRHYPEPFTKVRNISSPLHPEDVARALIYALDQPRHVRIPEILITPGESGQ